MTSYIHATSHGYTPWEAGDLNSPTGKFKHPANAAFKDIYNIIYEK